jgi:signal peptidase I
MNRTRRQIIAVAVFLLVAGYFGFTYRVAVVRGDSMIPTYSDGQYVLVNRLFQWTGGLHKGDVVLIRKGNEVLIKRVAYLPGEVLRGREARPFFRSVEFFDRPSPAESEDRRSLKVPADSVVVLGDNRAVSEDSRLFGPIPLSDVLGRVVNAPPKP